MTQIWDGGELDLAAIIRPGDRVVCGQGSAEALTLTETLVRQRAALGGIGLFLGPSYSGTFRPEHADHIAFTGYGAIGHGQALARAGALDIVPSHYSQLPSLFASGILAADAVLLQLSPADASGRHSLGLANDYAVDAARRARVVVAEINEQVPWTHGGELPDDIRLDHVIHTSRPPCSPAAARRGTREEQVARRVAALVPDGATIQLGVGALPDAVLAALAGHRELGVHSGLMGDGVVPLIERGVVTNARKPIDPGVTIANVLFGSRRLFDFVHRNPQVRLCPPSYSHGAASLARLRGFVAINAAVEVDLGGQVNSEIADGVYIGAVGGAVDFARAAGTGEGGRSIIALPATTGQGRVSRIVPRIASAVVTIPRSDADIVVTEWGVAELRGRSLAERARRMIAIAAPEHREGLERAARG